MLSGYRPYLSSEAIHPNTILHSKLEEARHLSIVDQVFFVTCFIKHFNAETINFIYVFLCCKSFILNNVFSFINTL
jgi:hypothetical protein